MHVLLLRRLAGASQAGPGCYVLPVLWLDLWIGPRGNVVGAGAAASNVYVFVGFRQESYKAFDHTYAGSSTQSGHGDWSTHDGSLPTYVLRTFS